MFLSSSGILTVNGGAIFNESSNDADFRVESNNLDDALFVQGSDGFVGVGTKVPGTKVHVELVGNGTGLTNALHLQHIGTTAGDGARILFTAGTSSGGAAIGSQGVSSDNSRLMLYANDTEEIVRLDGVANSYAKSRVLINITAPAGSGDGCLYVSENGEHGRVPLALNNTASGTNSHDIMHFYRNGTLTGKITNSNSATAYATSSDYRLKENIVAMDNATTRLKQLQPKRFNFIADADTTVDGFIAHEVSSIVPEAVSGIKDAVLKWKTSDELPEGVSVGDNRLDGDGNTIIDAQGIDQAKLVPLLVKTVQELEARIKTLEDA